MDLYMFLNVPFTHQLINKPMDLNSLIYSENAANVQLVISANDLRDFADNLIEFATRKIKERDEPTYYSRDELLEVLHVTDPTLNEYRRKGLIPEPIKIAGGKVLYDKAKVLEAIESGQLKIRNRYR